TGCTFSGNSALGGGGMSNSFDSNPTVTNCSFSGNSAGSGGGMMNETDSSPRVTQCIFSENTTNSLGAGMANFDSSSPTVTNCTLNGNSAGSGGGMYNNNNSSPVVTNCILWNDGPDEIVDVSGAVTTVRFSDVQRGWPGQGNIDADPQFVDPANGDLHLSSGSECIDAGDPNGNYAGQVDMDGELRVWNGRVDMGADEFGSFVFGDLNCDGAFNGGDIDPFFLALGDPAAYGVQFPNCDFMLADMNGDGAVNGADIDVFFECLGGGGCP
ncbi:MAG: hypothetical protein GY953_52965, partial [bacterium]|nr:hypothetical protein [bacterium]